jgi:hypothetical protein
MPNYGSEGLGEPVSAFKTEEQAKAWHDSVMRLPACASMKIAAVPLFYFAPTTLVK